MKNEGNRVFCIVLSGEKSVPLGELDSSRDGHRATGPSKLAVPALSFWLCGVQEGKWKHPIHRCSEKTEEGEGVHSSPLPDYDQQERCSIQSRYEYRIGKCVGTISNAVEDFLLSVLLPQATIQLLHSASYQPAPLLLPSRANTEAQWDSWQALCLSSFPPPLPASFVLPCTLWMSSLGSFFNLICVPSTAQWGPGPLLGSEWIMMVSASISAESAGCILSAAYRGTTAHS